MTENIDRSELKIVHDVIEFADSKFKHYWSELFANDPLQNPFYSQNSSELLHRSQSASHYVDRSFVVIAEGKPVFACSLTMHTDERGRKCLGYFGLEASSHVNRLSMQTSSNNFKLEAVQVLQHHINRLIDEIQPNILEYLDPVSCGIMSPVTQVLLEKGARPIVQTAKIIDLTLSEHALKRKIRQSQRSMINWGQRNLDISIASEQNFSDTDTAALARIFAGAVKSGDSPYSSLERYEQLFHQGNAFMVQGNLKNERRLHERHSTAPVASALFVHTARTCHCLFGSSVEQAPERPMMPALIWTALQHSKSLGCSLFEMGRLAHSDTSNTERSRLLNSFGGDSQTRLKICLAS